MDRKKNYTYKPKVKKQFKLSDGIEITDINTSSPVVQQNLSFSTENKIDTEKLFLFGIDRKDNLHMFDLINKKFTLKKILGLEDISETFKKDYQYDGTIIYNTLNGFFILTGKKSDTLYYYSILNETIIKICKFNYTHDNGSLMLDKQNDKIFVFSGKNTQICEYFSFKDKKVEQIADINVDRANASFVISNDKIFGFFGFCYKKDTYAGSIEYIDYNQLNEWKELKIDNIIKKGEGIRFDSESISTIQFNEEPNKIIIYSGIQGDDEDFVTDYFYVFDTNDNSLSKVDKWINNQFKYSMTKWKKYTPNKKDLKGFHFAKNSNFLEIPDDGYIKDYSDKCDNMAVLIDYKNNIHFFSKDQKIMDLYRTSAS